MVTVALTAADEERRIAFHRMRRVATSLLIVAAIIFVLTLHRDGALSDEEFRRAKDARLAEEDA